MKIINKYACEICRTIYDKADDALECEKQGIPKPKAKVGDIVEFKYGFGWFNGNEKWVINPKVVRKKKHGNCFGKCCTFGFYYVVTYISGVVDERHNVKYYLATNAMSGKHGHHIGYELVNDSDSGFKIFKEPPKFVIEDSKNLIGKRVDFFI